MAPAATPTSRNVQISNAALRLQKLFPFSAVRNLFSHLKTEYDYDPNHYRDSFPIRPIRCDFSSARRSSSTRFIWPPLPLTARSLSFHSLHTKNKHANKKRDPDDRP